MPNSANRSSWHWALCSRCCDPWCYSSGRAASNNSVAKGSWRVWREKWRRLRQPRAFKVGRGPNVISAFMVTRILGSEKLMCFQVCFNRCSLSITMRAKVKPIHGKRMGVVLGMGGSGQGFGWKDWGVGTLHYQHLLEVDRGGGGNTYDEKIRFLYKRQECSEQTNIDSILGVE